MSKNTEAPGWQLAGRGEELPPGTWHGEELPPGTWHCGQPSSH